MKNKVNILGTDYEIIWNHEDTDIKLRDANGYIEIYSHKIVLDSKLYELKDEPESFDNFDAYINRVIRHEVIHAFFAESGLRTNSDFAQNEELIDWLAIQFYKIAKVFKELGIED